MTDGQLIAAISSLMDEKLAPIKSDIAELKSDVAELKQRVTNLESEVAVLKQDVAVLKQDVSELKQTTAYLQRQYLNMQVTLEHEVIPQLREIQSCYTSTYYRYASGVEQIDTLQRDMDVLKAVVEDHSKKLQIIMCS